MKIENVNIYNQFPAFLACRYPMMDVLDNELTSENIEKGMERMEKLASVPTGTGHDNALS